jgi:hypothetical protein
MKKLFVFILALIYLSEASGLGLHLHYCMDKLVSWGLTETNKKCPAVKHSAHHLAQLVCQDCCKDEYKTAKLDNTEKTVQFFFSKPISVKADPTIYYLEPGAIAIFTKIQVNSINAPPNTHKVPIFIFNNIFRI